jgi:hypothetical protein
MRFAGSGEERGTALSDVDRLVPDEDVIAAGIGPDVHLQPHRSTAGAEQ